PGKTLGHRNAMVEPRPAGRHILAHEKTATGSGRTAPAQAENAVRGDAAAAARDRRAERSRADPLRRLGNRRTLHRLLAGGSGQVGPAFSAAAQSAIARRAVPISFPYRLKP